MLRSLNGHIAHLVCYRLEGLGLTRIHALHPLWGPLRPRHQEVHV